jgi:hypothetical protein
MRGLSFTMWLTTILTAFRAGISFSVDAFCGDRTSVRIEQHEGAAIVGALVRVEMKG